MLTLKDITFGYLNEPILDKITGTIGPGQKVGLVGVNGAGKSTLLKIIVGEINPDFGSVKNTMTTGYIAQELSTDSKFDNIETIREFINKDISNLFPDHSISKLLSKIGMSDKTPDSKFHELSGGQKTKAAIVKLLLEEPALLVLDEPTNFLDIPSANWLMSYLGTYPGAIFVISHDLRLMNKSIDKVWFLNEVTHKVEQYKGNYNNFIAQKDLEDEQLVKKIKKEQQKYKKLLSVANHLSGQHSTKSKVKGAKYREKAAALKEKTPKQNKKSKRMKIRYDIKLKPGYKILEAKNIAKSFQTDTGLKQVLFNINLQLTRRQRLVIIGVNGAGKSTLLKIIAGILQPDNGPEGKAFIEIGHNVDLGYYAQEYENFSPDSTPLEEFGQAEEGRVRGFLGNFLFSRDQVFQKTSSLSGGEKTRLALVKLFYQGHNFLLLDEPTTFLDPASQKILSETLISYPETVILISHDPDLVASFNPTHALLLPEEKFTHYESSLLDRVTIY